MKILSTFPRQLRTRESKLKWLSALLQTSKADAVFLPQEFFGGVVMMPKDKHIPLDWIIDKCGTLAKKNKKILGVGAAITPSGGGGATEDYLYFERDGSFAGSHRKYALPSYDDVRAKGGGELWPETNFERRATPIEIKSAGLRIGTIFCWEVFSQALWVAYAQYGVNLIVHPIKFAPKAWPNLEKNAHGVRFVKKFTPGTDKRNLWIDRLLAAARHEVFCPIVISCNSWDLGEKFLGLVGHIDEMLGTTTLIEPKSLPGAETLHVFEINPRIYNGFDSLFSLVQYREATGGAEHFHSFDPWKMHFKVRRLESHLIGGTTLLSCKLKASTLGRQSKSAFTRAAKKGLA